MKIVFHNGNKHQVDVRLMTLWSPKASILNEGSTSRIVDGFPEAVWQIFLDLCHSREISMTPEHIPQLLQLIKNWEANKLITELENRIIQKRDPSAVVKYYAAAPETFQNLRQVMCANFVEFSKLSEFVHLPASILSSIMHPNTEFPSVVSIRERFRSIRDRLHPEQSKSDTEESRLLLEIADLRKRLDEARKKRLETERLKAQSARRTAVAEDRADAVLSEINGILRKMRHQIDEMRVIQMETDSINDKIAELREQTFT